MIYLRELEVADAEVLLEMLVRDRAFLDQWEPTRPDTFYKLETHQRRLEMLQSDENFADFGIFLSAGDELVGRLQLSGISRGPFQNAYLGYFVSERHNGRGYATEAVSAVLAWGDAELGRRQTVCLISPDNLPSLRVAAKAGYREQQRTTYKGQPTIIFERGVM